jgi:hypothetical protein
MKKVIFYLLIPIIFQSCTDELLEIDSIVLSEDFSPIGNLVLDSKDVPNNSFTAFYYSVQNDKATVNNTIEEKIDRKKGRSNLVGNDLSAYWEGYFEFDSGEYEFSVSADKSLKVSIDDVIIFDGTKPNSSGGVTFAHSLQGVRRLKVFYNMNSAQKVQKIIEYYNSMRGHGKDHESGKPGSTATNAANNSDLGQAVLVDWRKL